MTGLNVKLFMGMLLGIGLMSNVDLKASEFCIPDCWGRAHENGVNQSFRVIEEGICYDRTSQKALEAKIYTLRVMQNHFLLSLDMALERNVQASENQMNVVDALYDSLGDIPGHWGRHHRSFRDHLRGRFEGIDHQLKEFEARLKGNHQLQHESVANLTNQRQTLSQRFAAMEARMITLEEENKILKEKIIRLEDKNSGNNDRPSSPTRRR